MACLFIIPNKSELSNVQLPNDNGVSACQFLCVAPVYEENKVRHMSEQDWKSLGALNATCAFQEALDRYTFESLQKKKVVSYISKAT